MSSSGVGSMYCCSFVVIIVGVVVVVRYRGARLFVVRAWCGAHGVVFHGAQLVLLFHGVVMRSTCSMS